jgi:hypothetical protein
MESDTDIETKRKVDSSRDVDKASFSRMKGAIWFGFPLDVMISNQQTMISIRQTTGEEGIMGIERSGTGGLGFGAVICVIRCRVNYRLKLKLSAPHYLEIGTLT